MKNYYLGIDLGSTTSKAVIVDEEGRIAGKGITNTRANYMIATEIARQEALYNARFNLLKQRLSDTIIEDLDIREIVQNIENAFKFIQFKRRLEKLHIQFLKTIDSTFDTPLKEEIKNIVNQIVKDIEPEIKKQFLFYGLGNKSQFFRDIVSEHYNEEVLKYDKEYFDPLILVYDKSITPVENEMYEFDFHDLIDESLETLNGEYKNLETAAFREKEKTFNEEISLLQSQYSQFYQTLKDHIHVVSNQNIHIKNMVGTGYGRALLPFPEENIRSEILCHAFGAHAFFPNTRTVLDIGGQDTKAIQVDSHGLVTSFQMNDRCAAGCGRYLGYIADEFNMSLNELGPTTMNANKEVNICSTCTVFAGAEVRELINVGEKKPDILAGLHKAIVMRAMSLLARSGGVRNEFTFTGGVARNQAVTKYVNEMVRRNYGQDIKINIHYDSIFMGALGAALFARRSK